MNISPKDNLQSYEGTEPYIFVSYSHKDSAKVFAVLGALIQKGCRVCYDTGIEPGIKWRTWIAEHISHCTVFLAFHSKSSSVSEHCRAEIEYAISAKCTIVSIFLEKVVLDEGLKMYLNPFQSLSYSNLDLNSLIQQLLRNKHILPCFSHTTDVQEIEINETKAKKRNLVVFFVFIISLFSVFALVVYFFGKQPAWTINEEGTLIISPGPFSNGRMPNYRMEQYQGNTLTIIGHAPWLKSKEQISAVILDSGFINISVASFAGCSRLTAVLIPDSVVSIDDYAFYQCTALKDFFIPENVVSIGNYTFSACTNMTQIVFSPFSQLSHIGQGAFSNCSNLPSIDVPDGVVGIDTSTFDNCISLSNVNLPSSVLMIGAYSFSSCTNLTELIIPDNVSEIGEGAFLACAKLSSITMTDSVYKIGSMAFAGCFSLASVTIPPSIREVGSFAFFRCVGIKSVSIEGDILEISQGAFSGCDGLIDVTISGEVYEISFAAFEGCSKLSSVTLPDTTTKIYDCAFAGCSSLLKVVVPSNVYIAEGAFDPITEIIRKPL